MINGRFPLIAAVLAVLGAATFTSASADDAAKKLLGRAQSKSESQAVEDLIKKLQGPAGEKPSPPPAVAKPETPPPPQDTAKAPAAPEPAKPEPAKPEPPPVVTAKPAPPLPVETAKPAPPPQPEPAKTAAPAAPPAPPPPATAAASPAPPPISVDQAQEKADRNELPTADLVIYFDYKSSKISAEATEVLDTLGRALADGRLAGDRFLIAGHTDARGQPGQNLALSQRRAESVRKYLIDTFQIDEAKLEAKGFGESRLKNGDDPNADENRRVQIVNISAAEARR